MPKASPALLVALLLVAALAAPASVGGVTLLDTSSTAAAPAEGLSENTTRVLRLDQIQASGFGEPQLVVLDAAAMQEADLDTEYSIAAVDERLATAENATVTRRILGNYTDAVAQDVAALKAAEREARLDYIAGDITAQEYAQRLAVIHARADALHRFLGSTASQQPNLLTYTSPYPALQDRVNYLREEIRYLTGPVRNEMARVVRGERDSIRVFVAASSNGFEVSHIRFDGVYVRSAYRADNLDDDTSGGRSIDTVLRLAPQLYPWAVPDRNLTGPGSVAATPLAAHGSIHMTINHPHGRVLSNVDETTEQVYYEIQYKRLRSTDPDVATVPVEYQYNRTKNDTRVLVSQTYPGGPLQVAVLDASSSNRTGRVDVPVTINETTTHRTDGDGIVWFISPAGDYNVTTSYNGTKFHFNVTT